MASSIELWWSPQWELVVADGRPCVLTAGPDVRFELDGLGPAASATLQRWRHGEVVDLVAEGDIGELRTLLVGLGVLVPSTAERRSVALAGDVAPDEVAAALARRFDLAPGDTERDLVLVVRTGSAWPTAPAGPHLGIDLTHHHTLVLGPLVLPGSTSCLQCLARQIERRWGPDVVPAAPAIGTAPTLIAELVSIQVDRLVAGTSPLVNATMTWDFGTGHSERNDLLRAPDCGGPCRLNERSTITLPWPA